jgi:phosphoglycerate dehydrogenase-like enzyme
MRLVAFDTTTLYFSRTRADQSIEESLNAKYVSFDEIIRSVDVLSLHCPLNDETRLMIGKKELAEMKNSSLLINTARGGIIDHDALYGALCNNSIAGAGLDVVTPMPPPSNMPLLSLKNVVVTPHTAGITVESWPKRLKNAVLNVQRLADGKRPMWVIPELRNIS